jgi:hypothetical protein
MILHCIQDDPLSFDLLLLMNYQMSDMSVEQLLCPLTPKGHTPSMPKSLLFSKIGSWMLHLIYLQLFRSVDAIP